ncbi:MAG: toll/interleukin-1 receptor domain-containing protein [Myxococcota bacterium]
MASLYDVFVSHSGRDKTIVERLCHALCEFGIRPWFDKWALGPGTQWLLEIERVIEAVPLVFVCVGAHGWSAWQDAERQACLDRCISSDDCSLVPLLLPGAPEPVDLPALLKSRQCVDLRDESMWVAEVQRLAVAIAQKKYMALASSVSTGASVAVQIEYATDVMPEVHRIHALPRGEADPSRPPRGLDERVLWRLRIEGELELFSEEERKAALDVLTRLSGDISLKITRMSKGSIVLDIELSRHGCVRIQNAMRNGGVHSIGQRAILGFVELGGVEGTEQARRSSSAGRTRLRVREHCVFGRERRSGLTILTPYGEKLYPSVVDEIQRMIGSLRVEAGQVDGGGRVIFDLSNIRRVDGSAAAKLVELQRYLLSVQWCSAYVSVVPRVRGVASRVIGRAHDRLARSVTDLGAAVAWVESMAESRG